jgi:hypothetical protein
MRKFYFIIQIVLIFFSIFPSITKAQDCSLLTAKFKTYESRCAATGSIKVTPSGGSGSYKYKTLTPINSNYTTSDSLTGLAAGPYTVVVTDIVSNCSFTQSGIVVPGSYQDPRFALTKTDVTCDGGNNGIIQVNGLQFGTAPFLFSIVAPSAMGIGTKNNSGLFKNLSAGDYTIRLADSCGGIQTRQITINDYKWWIDSYNFNKTICDSANGFIKVIDSKGNISTSGGIPGFTYGIVRKPGDTIWSSNPNFKFYLAKQTNFQIVVKDNCGTIRKGPSSLSITPAINAIVVSSKSCNSFTATVKGTTNFFNPKYCLYDNNDILVTCNTTGVFTNIAYGNYCIHAYDACTDSTLVRCISSSPPAISISNTVAISKRTCKTFTATVTGQSGLTNPNYCLLDSANKIIVCNKTGIFNNVVYGRYCINVTDGCQDTTIKVCFIVRKSVPKVPDVIVPYYNSCSTFGVTIGGDSLISPRYCLYDSAKVLVICNNTGIFNGLSFGRYCANVYDSCFDTTFIRCFTVAPPVITNDVAVVVSNKTCLTFTIKASSNNLKKASYCLYSSTGTLISCDSSGIFNNLLYGSYCIKAKSICPDTTFKKCFTVTPDLPSVNGSVKLINTTCLSFSAQIYGQQNLNNPNYCLYNNSNVLVNCNSTGQFDNLAYGKYCIKITNSSCYDTIITRCFTADPVPVKITVTANKSCSYNYAKISISISSNSPPFIVKIFDPVNNLFYTKSFNSNNVTIDSIPGTITGETYKIIVRDNCNTVDSVSIGTVASYLSHITTAVPKCPSGTYPNGSGDIKTTASTNMGSLLVKIIKKDNVTLTPNLSPNTIISGVYTFQDLAPATYILSYKANDACNIYYYDTVVLKPYQYPNLNRSSAYRCISNGFSIQAVVSDGVGPFKYEIIGSSPTAPSIVAGPQISPFFAINNGVNYSLVRLRAIDACGNATLADASILPLANNGITSSFNCFQIATTLKIDTVYNATYAWYKKSNANSTDSTYIGGASSVFIPYILPSDTGIYVCNLIVHTGCITRSFNYHLDGACARPLPVSLYEFTGKFADEKVLLGWKVTEQPDLKHFVVERRTGNNDFVSIGIVKANGNADNILHYNFIDDRPELKNLYRLKFVNNDETFAYSNAIALNRNKSLAGIQLYPNPVNNVLNIVFPNRANHSYKINLLSSLNQSIKEIKFTTNFNNNLQITRTAGMKAGMYILKITDIESNEEITEKIIFK